MVGNISGYIRCVCIAITLVWRTVMGYNLFLPSGTKDYLKEFAAKEKLEIVIRAAPPPFRILAGELPRRRRWRKRFGLIQE